jgi:hypothetical protein
MKQKAAITFPKGILPGKVKKIKSLPLNNRKQKAMKIAKTINKTVFFIRIT